MNMIKVEGEHPFFLFSIVFIPYLLSKVTVLIPLVNAIICYFRNRMDLLKSAGFFKKAI